MTSVEMAAARPTSWLDRGLASIVRVDVEVLVYAALVVLGVATRFYDLDTRVMSHDESLHTYFSWQLEQGRGYQHTPLMHGPLQFHWVGLTYFLFGDSDASARIPAALSGVAAIGLLALFRKWLGRTGALLAAGMMLVSPYMLFYSRYVRNEMFVVVESLLMFYAVFRYYETRRTKWLYLLSATLMLHFASKETSFIYTAQLMLFLGALLAWQLLAIPWDRPTLKPIFSAGLVVTVVGAAIALFMLFRERSNPLTPETGAPLDPSTASLAGSTGFSPLVTVGLALAVGGLLLTAIPLILSFGSRLRREFPVLDMLIIAGTVTAPQLGAFPANLLGWNPMSYEDLNADYRTAYVVLLLLAISVLVGMAWDWRRWLIAFGVFYLPYIVLYSTLFTNPLGVYSGIVGSLGYWIEQHGVHRGSQPWYYYLLVQVPVYEYLPALGSLLAAGIGVARWARPKERTATSRPSTAAADFPVLPFLGFWTVTAMAAYSFAGERMPWLTVHIALPLILLAGWGFGQVFGAIDWQTLRDKRTWLILGLLGAAVLALGSAAGQLFGPTPPFQGQDLAHLTATTSFLTVLASGAIAIAVLWIVLRGTPQLHFDHLAGVVGFGMLFLFTSRTAFRAAYVNGDTAKEFLVYAHSGTGVKTVLNQVAELSQRTTEGLAIDIAYDDDVSWPFTWYLRNFTNVHYYGPSPTRDLLNYPVVIAGDNNWAKVEPILGDRYFSFEYIRMWWPMQDYFDLTWERIRNAVVSPEYRRALWEIWFNRDYTAYGQLTGADYSLEHWSPSDRMRLYIRKDVEALIWEYGVTPSTLEVPSVEDPYARGSVNLTADLVLGGLGTDPGQFQTPRDIAFALDGTYYVADTLNHRIQHFAADGTVLQVWGQFADIAKTDAPGGTFNEPWGIAVAPDGRVYVADTWNHRVQWFSPEGTFQGMVGFIGQAESLDALWGPRDVVVDSDGRFFVSDTGNKRVVVFDRNGTGLGAFGEVGVLSGQMDEPVGLALDAQGRMFIADTWNQRIQFFDASPGSGFPVGGEWHVEAWFGDSLDNKPSLAVAPDGHVCASDPEGYRVLCFTATGEFATAFGAYGQGGNQFGLVSGLAFAPDGSLWAVDSGNSRVMRFTPDFTPEAVPQPSPTAVDGSS